MKKEEALTLVPHRSKLIIQYIEQILSINKTVKGKMIFGFNKIEKENMCTLEIYVPDTDFEKHINLGITSDHCDLLYAQLFKDFLTTFLEHETIGISRYYTVKYGMQENFSGVNAINSNGSELKINFICSGHKFDEVTSEYNNAINKYIEGIKKEQEEQKIGSR